MAKFCGLPLWMAPKGIAGLAIHDRTEGRIATIYSRLHRSVLALATQEISLVVRKVQSPVIANDIYLYTYKYECSR